MIKKILIVGLGSIGKRHLRIGKILFPEADIRILRHARGACEHEDEGEKTFYSLQDAVSFRPHIAILANPAPFHLSLAQNFADIGTHLLIEKPLSDTMAGVESVIDTCQRNNVVLMTGYNLRFLPSLIAFKNYIHQLYIGDIFSVRAEVGQNLRGWRPGTDYRQNVSSKRELGGGVLLELSHELDYLRWIFGEIEWVQSILSKQSNLEIDVEDSVHAFIGFKKKWGGSSQLISTLNLDFIRHDTSRTCTVIGERGSLRWDGIKNCVDLYEEKTRKWRCLFSGVKNRDFIFIEEWKNFTSCVLGKENLIVSGKDGLEALKIIEAMRESSKKRKVIYL